MIPLGLYGAAQPVASGDYVGEVMADSPLGFWRMEEPSGDILYDHTSAGRDLALVGGLTAYSIAGPGSLSAHAWPAAFDNYALGPNQTLSTVTVTVWVKMPSVPFEAISLTSYATAYGSQVNDKDLYLLAGGVPAFRVYAGSPVVCSGGAISGNTWHHISGSVGPDGMRVTLDGEIVATNGTTYSYSGQALKFLLKGTPNTSLSRSDSALSIGPVAVFGTQLSAARVAAHYAAGVA